MTAAQERIEELIETARLMSEELGEALSKINLLDKGEVNTFLERIRETQALVADMAKTLSKDMEL